jgi:hypothetical protein
LTAEEWVNVSELIAAIWPHQAPPPESVAAWYPDVDDIEQRDAIAAVRALSRAGREFPPNGGLIRRKAIELAADAPEWSDVWGWVQRYVRTGVANPMYFQANYAGRDRPDHPSRKAERLKDRMPPLAARFVEAVGDRQLAEACDQEGGGEARLREKWHSWERRVEREAGMRGLDSGLAAIDRVNRGPEPLSEALGRLVEPLGRDFQIEPAEGER